MRFLIRSCTIRIHPLFLCMLFILFSGGAGHFALSYLLVLFLHESAHFLCALLLHIHVSQIEITPLGGSMQLPLSDALAPHKAFLLSSAGIISNFLGASVAFLLCVRYSLISPPVLYFIQCNLLMLCINLLPVLPLDGGRMLLAAASAYFDRAHVLRILLAAGRILCVFLLLSSLFYAFRGIFRPAPALLALYLLYGAALEEKNSISRYLASFMARRVRIEKRKTLPVQTLCASSAMPLFLLLPHLRPGAYHIVYVTDENTLSGIGILREDVLLSAILDSCAKTLGEICSETD